MNTIKNLEHYLKLEYPFSVRPLLEDEGSGWVVEFPDLRGCIGTGDSELEAIQDAKAAKKAYIEDMLTDGEDVPSPYSSEQCNGRLSLRMPKSLHRWVDITAKTEGISTNQYINHILSMAKGKKSST